MPIFRNLPHGKAAGRAVAAARGLLDLSQMQVAEAVGVAQATIGKLEKGVSSVKQDTKDAVLD